MSTLEGDSMHVNLSTWRGWAITFVVLFVPAFFVAYFLHSAKWIILVPLVIIAIAVIVAALPIKRAVTPDQFADELEAHLLGTEGAWDWDDTTSVAIADPRLDMIRRQLFAFDSASLKSEKDRTKLKGLIEMLRRGELPEIIPPTHLTYGDK